MLGDTLTSDEPVGADKPVGAAESAGAAGSAGGAGSVGAGVRDESPPPRGPAPVHWLVAHPLLTVAVVASAIALGHAVWVWQHRHLGGFDPDESGYLAASLRIERTVRSLAPVELLRQVITTGNGVTVPLLSVPLVLVGPRDPRTAMMVQPLLLVLTAVGTAGITRRIAGPRAAILAGALVAALPGMSTAAQSYWYGLGATAALTIAVWALLASDRCSNDWIWVLGVATGLMLLSRTMTLGYVPAVAVAGLVVAGRDRHRLTRLASALGLGLAVAAPWYVINRDSIFGYLLSYGYGERAGLFGDGDVLDRTAFRIDRFATSIGPALFRLLWISAAAAIGLALVRLAVQSRSGTPSSGRVRSDRWRSAGAVAACLVAGTAALVSTTNNGVWFELPLVPLLIVLAVCGISAAPRWTRPGLAVVAATAAVVSAQSLWDQWWLTPYRTNGPTAHYEYGFAQYDTRFGPDRRAEHATAAAEWDAFYRQVLATIRPSRTGPEDPVFTFSGNMQLFNTNSLVLTGELSGWSPRLEVPDTAEPPATRARHLSPTADYRGTPVRRVLIVAEHDRILFTPDADVAGFLRQARRSGWRETATVPMPIPGRVLVLEHTN